MKNVILIVNLILFSNIFGMRDQDNEWFEAVRWHDIEKVDQMMKDGINPNIRTRDGSEETALMIALKNGSSSLVKYLIRKDEMNCKDIVNLLTMWKNSGRKLSDQFIQNRFGNMVDINARSRSGMTALMYACGHPLHEYRLLFLLTFLLYIQYCVVDYDNYQNHKIYRKYRKQYVHKHT